MIRRASGRSINHSGISKVPMLVLSMSARTASWA